MGKFDMWMVFSMLYFNFSKANCMVGRKIPRLVGMEHLSLLCTAQITSVYINICFFMDNAFQKMKRIIIKL